MPKFQKVHCSQCGGEFGPRDGGYSHCEDHQREQVFRFDADSYCVIFCREHSDVVQMSSNIADAETAQMHADGIRSRGGHVLEVCSAGVLVAALKLIRNPTGRQEYGSQ